MGISLPLEALRFSSLLRRLHVPKLDEEQQVVNDLESAADDERPSAADPSECAAPAPSSADWRGQCASAGPDPKRVKLLLGTIGRWTTLRSVALVIGGFFGSVLAALCRPYLRARASSRVVLAPSRQYAASMIGTGRERALAKAEPFLTHQSADLILELDDQGSSLISHFITSAGVSPRPSGAKFQVLPIRASLAMTRCRPASVPLDSV